MKKTIATVFAALVALAAAAQWHYLPADAGRYTLLHTQNIDTLHKQATTTQRVFNALSTPIRNVYFTRFQVNCLALAEDLNGLAEGAQVCGIALQGQNLGGSRDLTMSFYAQNTPMRDQEVDGLGFAYNPFPDDELLVARDVHCQLPEGEGRTTLFDVNFEPFQYDGDNVLITLDISLPEGDTVNFSFDMAPAAAANALLIRTEQYCINAMTDLLPVFMPDFDFTFNAAQLPAFDMRYYTHDVRGRITDAHGQPLQGLSVRLRDEFMKRDFMVGSVVITHYNGQRAADQFRHRLERMGIKSYIHYLIDGYPHNVELIASDEGFGKNDYVETSRELVIVTAPGPGSGKMAVCLSQAAEASREHRLRSSHCRPGRCQHDRPLPSGGLRQDSH